MSVLRKSVTLYVSKNGCYYLMYSKIKQRRGADKKQEKREKEKNKQKQRKQRYLRMFHFSVTTVRSR